jgi:hypothetical protein
MSKHSRLALLPLIILAPSIFAGPAAAASPCAAGLENVAGTCVTAGLAGSMRLRSVVMNQEKIGYNFPIPPRLDDTYPKNFDVNRFEFSQLGNFSTNPNPPSR